MFIHVCSHWVISLVHHFLHDLPSLSCGQMIGFNLVGLNSIDLNTGGTHNYCYSSHCFPTECLVR